MRIGQIALKTQVSVQTLRYYERRGLLPKLTRRPSGYRTYAAAEVQRVRFIRRAQDLGFTLAEIADLLAMRADSRRACREVERRASATLQRIDEKIRGLKEMRSGLAEYVKVCRTRTGLEDCPLLSRLGRDESDSQ